MGKYRWRVESRGLSFVVVDEDKTIFRLKFIIPLCEITSWTEITRYFLEDPFTGENGIVKAKRLIRLLQKEN